MTSPTAWNETQKYKGGAKEQTNKSLWNLDGNSQLSWVLYRVSIPHLQQLNCPSVGANTWAMKMIAGEQEPMEG